jgi:fatty acid desaturase
MFPMVPYYNLAELHKELQKGGQMPKPYSGMWEVSYIPTTIIAPLSQLLSSPPIPTTFIAPNRAYLAAC